MLPDGRSFITAVGTRRVAIAMHDKNDDKPIVSEGRPALAWSWNASPFSSDGTKI
jgi:Lon protease-like protein